MDQYRLIDGNKYTTLMQDVNNEGDWRGRVRGCMKTDYFCLI